MPLTPVPEAVSRPLLDQIGQRVGLPQEGLEHGAAEEGCPLSSQAGKRLSFPLNGKSAESPTCHTLYLQFPFVKGKQDIVET